MKQSGIKSGFNYRKRVCHRRGMRKCSRVSWCFNRTRVQINRGNSCRFNPTKQVTSHVTESQLNVGFLNGASRCISHVCLTLTSPHSLLYGEMMDLTHLSSNAPAIYACADMVQVCCYWFSWGGGSFYALDATSPQRRNASIYIYRLHQRMQHDIAYADVYVIQFCIFNRHIV